MNEIKPNAKIHLYRHYKILLLAILTTEEFNEEKHNEARIDAAKEFIEIELKLDQNEINIEQTPKAVKTTQENLAIKGQQLGKPLQPL